MKVIPTIQQFLESLENPSEKLLNALRGGDLEGYPIGGRPQILRLTHFAEATINHPNGSIRILLPLRAEVASQARQCLARRTAICSPHLAPASYLPEAFPFTDSLGHTHWADLIVEHLPQGRPLDELLLEGVAAERMVAALNRLQTDFQTRRIAHNNLKPEHLWYSRAGEFFALRGWLITFDGASAEDERSFAALETRIWAADSRPLAEKSSTEHLLHASKEYDEVGRMCEEMIRVCKKGLYGYLQSDGQWAIEPRFLWAEDFREGRAEVKTESGYGVIDKEGNFLLHPCCERVEWDEMSGTIRAWIEGCERLFDYDGEELVG